MHAWGENLPSTLVFILSDTWRLLCQVKYNLSPPRPKAQALARSLQKFEPLRHRCRGTDYTCK